MEEPGEPLFAENAGGASAYVEGVEKGRSGAEGRLLPYCPKPFIDEPCLCYGIEVTVDALGEAKGDVDIEAARPFLKIDSRLPGRRNRSGTVALRTQNGAPRPKPGSMRERWSLHARKQHTGITLEEGPSCYKLYERRKIPFEDNFPLQETDVVFL